MAVDLKGRNFLTLRDFTAEEISHYLELAAQLKADKKNGTMKKYMEGKNIALIFEKPSTRTGRTIKCGASAKKRVFHCRPNWT